MVNWSRNDEYPALGGVEHIQVPRTGITRHSALERKIETLTEVAEGLMDLIANLSATVQTLNDTLTASNDELSDEIAEGEKALAQAVGTYRTPSGNGVRNGTGDGR